MYALSHLHVDYCLLKAYAPKLQSSMPCSCTFKRTRSICDGVLYVMLCLIGSWSCWQTKCSHWSLVAGYSRVVLLLELVEQRFVLCAACLVHQIHKVCSTRLDFFNSVACVFAQDSWPVIVSFCRHDTHQCKGDRVQHNTRSTQLTPSYNKQPCDKWSTSIPQFHEIEAMNPSRSFQGTPLIWNALKDA